MAWRSWSERVGSNSEKIFAGGGDSKRGDDSSAASASPTAGRDIL